MVFSIKNVVFCLVFAVALIESIEQQSKKEDLQSTFKSFKSNERQLKSWQVRNVYSLF